MGNTFDAQGAGSVITVHPHACGEYFRSSHCLLISAGSSPRVWGILGWRRVYVRLTRFIPTRVGNTRPGESLLPAADGSSPRVWGIQAINSGVLTNTRFIPTRVGNTLAILGLTVLETGSSPRVWGIHFFHLVELPKVINVSGFYRNFPSTNLNSICAIPSF